MQVEQPGPGGLELRDEFLVGQLLAQVDPFQVDDQLEGDSFAELPDFVLGPGAGEDLAGLGGGQVLIRPAWDNLQQQLVELAGLGHMLLADTPAPVDQQPQHLQLVIGDDRLQATDPDPTRAIEWAAVSSVWRP